MWLVRYECFVVCFGHFVAQKMSPWVTLFLDQMLHVLCEKRTDRLNLRGNDMEQSHLLSPLLVIDAFCLFINFERWKVMSAVTAFQHFTVHWLKRYHYFRAGNQQICNVCFFALSLRGWNESCVGSSVWPGTASQSCRAVHGALRQTLLVCRWLN